MKGGRRWLNFCMCFVYLIFGVCVSGVRHAPQEESSNYLMIPFWNFLEGVKLNGRVGVASNYLGEGGE